MISIRRAGPRERVVRPWPGALVIFPKHYVPRRDEIWQAGKNLAKRCRK